MRLGRAQLPDMSDEGERVRQRRERLGLTQAQLGELAGGAGAPIHRNTIRAIEDGLSGNRAKLAAVLRALDAEEQEAGIDAPPLPESAGVSAERRPVVIRMGNDAVVVEGFAEDMAALVEAARQLWAIEQGSDVTPVSDDGGPV